MKILTLHNALPNVKSYRTIFFENLAPILESKTVVEITWVVYTPKKIDVLQKKPGITTLDIHDFNDATEIIRKIKPDIIYVAPGINTIDLAFSIASRFYKIPLIGGELGNPLVGRASHLEILKSLVTQFFDRSVPTDASESETMKRGRFFLYKFIFLFKTINATKKQKLELFQWFFTLCRIYFLGSLSGVRFSRFACDLNFVESEKVAEQLVKDGFQRSSIIISGNPTYDKIFQKLQKSKITKNDGKIRVLLITVSPMTQMGKWSRTLRDSSMQGIMRETSKHKDEISLVIKIHPTNEVLTEYQSLVNSIDPSIPVYQHGDIIDYLEQADVIISPSSNTAVVCGLISRKPIIIWNIFDVKNDVLLERNLAKECKDLSSLISSIRESLSIGIPPQEKVESFIREFLYKSDGKATERMASAILNLVQQNNLQKNKSS